MNINLDDIVNISVKEGAGIEKINIRYIRSNAQSTTLHSDQFDKNIKSSKNETSVSEEMADTSKSRTCQSPIECQKSPSHKRANRPKESYFFGQNPVPKYETFEEEKGTALYKVK